MAGRKVKQEMSKNLEAKKVVVSEISEKLKNCQSMVVVHFNGITVEEVTELRNQFRAAGVEYSVLKNTLVRRALDDMGITGLDHTLSGPSAYAFGMNDPVSPAKVVYDFINKNKDDGRLSVKAGLMDGQVLDAKQVKALSELPSKEVLLSRLVAACRRLWPSWSTSWKRCASSRLARSNRSLNLGFLLSTSNYWRSFS